MFGISWAEFFVIILVGVIVIPSRYWPDVLHFLGGVVRMVREFIWRLTDASEEIKRQIDLERPIDEMMATASDFIESVSQVRPTPQKQKSKTVKTKRAKK